LNIAGGNSAVNMTVTGPLVAAMTFTGGSGNDSITGGTAADNITAGAGNDTVIAGAGDDTVVGGLGADSFVGGEGTDTISYNFTLAADGGSTAATGVVVNLGATAITAAQIAAHRGNIVVVNQLNSDVSSVAAGTSGYLGLVASVSTRIDTLSGFENVIGSAGKDFIVGTSGANTISGLGGADVMAGGAGADVFVANTTSSIVASGKAIQLPSLTVWMLLRTSPH
jgi:Ca2+-binding RTX toxin-like protein